MSPGNQLKWGAQEAHTGILNDYEFPSEIIYQGFSVELYLDKNIYHNLQFIVDEVVPKHYVVGELEELIE